MSLDFEERVATAFPKSKEKWQSSLALSRGVHHDSRQAEPFPIYMSHAYGSHIWDVDGNKYIDYTMGHGSLMFGHSDPRFVEALSQQLARGTHYGSENEYALEWAQLIVKLVPAAEKIEFVMTGTEANMLIAQLARAYTGRHKILKFADHFFGWSDSLYAGLSVPFDKPMPGRLPPAWEDCVSDATVVIPINDQEAVERVLAKRDIAAFFIEGAGAHCGTTAIPPELVRLAREMTEAYGTLLVIDEVITGFRWGPGGYQATIGVTPDLSSLGKMVSGGLPGAAVCGRADVLEFLETKPGQAERNRYKRVAHPGTWNANPLSSIAGVTTLKMIESGEPQQKAAAAARRLAEGMNEKIEERGVEACAYNSSSVIHLHLGKCQHCDRANCYDTSKIDVPNIVAAMDMHLMLNGVHLLRGGIGWVSAVHSDEDIVETIDAFGNALDSMIADRVIDVNVNKA